MGYSHRRMGPRHVAILFAMLAGLIATVCGTSDPEVSRIVRATVPPGDAIPPVDGPRHDGHSFTFIWDFDTHMTSKEYAEWLKTELQTFDQAAPGPTYLRFAKLIGGDSYRLEVEIAASAQTHVRSVLTVGPD